QRPPPCARLLCQSWLGGCNNRYGIDHVCNRRCRTWTRYNHACGICLAPSRSERRRRLTANRALPSKSRSFESSLSSLFSSQFVLGAATSRRSKHRYSILKNRNLIRTQQVKTTAVPLGAKHRKKG